MEPDKSRQDDAPILVVPYDAAWPRLFEEERVVLENLLTQWLVGSIEHVGSTAVPGLAAKPVIDIMAGVKSLDDSRPAIPVLAAIDYCFSISARAETLVLQAVTCISHPPLTPRSVWQQTLER